MANKYNAEPTVSALCGRKFASKAECRRGEELCLLEKAGEIKDLQYQVKYVLSEKPRVTITIDFKYIDYTTEYIPTNVHEDTKGVLTRDFRTKLAWLKQKYNVDVILSR